MSAAKRATPAPDRFCGSSFRHQPDREEPEFRKQPQLFLAREHVLRHLSPKTPPLRQHPCDNFGSRRLISRQPLPNFPANQIEGLVSVCIAADYVQVTARCVARHNQLSRQNNHATTLFVPQVSLTVPEQ